MSNPVTSAKIPVAVSKVNKFNLPSPHLTTGNMMRFVPAFSREIVPDSHGSLHHKMFVRAMPMDKPCLGSFSINNRYFLVPFRCVWEPFSDFITDTPHTQQQGTGIIDQVPRISMQNLLKAFITPSYGNATSTTANRWDITSGNGVNYILTSKGRDMFKVMNALGYKLIPGLKGDFDYSALPFLCFVKVYLDWFYPSAYANYGNAAFAQGIFQRHYTYHLTDSEIVTLFDMIRFVCYDNDFFTAAWDNPSGPASNTGSINFVITDPTVQGVTGQQVVQDGNGTPVVDTTSGVFSQYTDESLKALTAYVKRHQLAGARGSLDRYLAQYGVLLDADKLRRSYYLGVDTCPFEIGDVMSTADTSNAGGASLGAYAGKGFAYSEGHSIDFETKEFAMLFVVNTIIPDVAYVEGYDRNNRHIFKLDYLNGEFDGLGPSAIHPFEIFTDPVDAAFNSANENGIFAFGPHQYENKIPLAKMSGDFVVNTINANLNGWSTMRLFPLLSGNSTALTHSMSFVRGEDADQFNRVFLGYSPNDPSDPFYIIHRDYLTLYSPMKHLYDNVTFEDDTSNSKSVTVEPNGVRMN